LENIYKTSKSFSPLDDLFELLQNLEKIFNVTITEKEYKIGREQLFFTFMHETIHAFITKKAPWIHDLSDDECDFVDELVVRVLIDDVIVKLNLNEKINPYFQSNINHKKDLKNYGFNLKIEEYEELEKKWHQLFSQEMDIDGYCKLILNYYKSSDTIKRKNDFNYDDIINKIKYSD